MDVFDRGVVHASKATGLRVESALKNSAKYRRADVSPFEVCAGLIDQQINHFLREDW